MRLAIEKFQYFEKELIEKGSLPKNLDSLIVAFKALIDEATSNAWGSGNVEKLESYHSDLVDIKNRYSRSDAVKETQPEKQRLFSKTDRKLHPLYQVMEKLILANTMSKADVSRKLWKIPLESCNKFPEFINKSKKNKKFIMLMKNLCMNARIIAKHSRGNPPLKNSLIISCKVIEFTSGFLCSHFEEKKFEERSAHFKELNKTNRTELAQLLNENDDFKDLFTSGAEVKGMRYKEDLEGDLTKPASPPGNYS